MESVHLDTTTAEVTADQNSGTEVGREVFKVTQGDVSTDILEEAGSGEVGRFVGHAGDEILKNASFQDLEGTEASPTAIPSWTSSVTVNSTNYSFDSTNFFRTSPEEKSAGTSRALNLKVTTVLSQKAKDLGLSLDYNSPYYMAMRFKRDGPTPASGTLKLVLGSQIYTVAVAAQTGYNLLEATLDNNLFPENFDEDDLDFKIDWTRTGGELLIDDVMLGKMTRYNGNYYFALGGSTHWLKKDKYTFATTLVGADSIVQRWFHYLYRVSLRSKTDGTETITDP